MSKEIKLENGCIALVTPNGATVGLTYLTKKDLIDLCNLVELGDRNRHTWVETGGWYSCLKCGIAAGGPRTEQSEYCSK